MARLLQRMNFAEAHTTVNELSMVDGSVHLIPESISTEAMFSLISRERGEATDREEL
jgi:hypothetical protein